MHVGLESLDGALQGECLDQQRDHDHVGEQRSEPDHVAALVEASPNVNKIFVNSKYRVGLVV